MRNQKKEDFIYFRCLEIVQPIGTFYIGVMDCKDLINISYADIRRIGKPDLDKYMGIERELSQRRVKELEDYVTFVDATFPNSIILSIESSNAKYIKKSQTMRLKNGRDVAKIIDGQHRIAGLEKFDNKKDKNFQVNITIFIDMDIEDQAMVFSTINLTQTKVSKSLVYDLYEYARSRSPQKTCHNIVKLLNNKENSPFKDKIKILGKATGKPTETLTQATFVERLINYISEKPNIDRDLLKRGKPLEPIDELISRKLIFGNMFREKKDAEIAKIVWNYFTAVKERWPKAWVENKPGNILNRTTGFGALMKLLRPAYLKETKKIGDIVSKDHFFEIFKKIKIEEKDFTPDNYKPGTSGETALYNELLEKSGIDIKSDLSPKN